VYLTPVATSAQLLPDAEQRCHLTELTLKGEDPTQLPCPRTSTCPGCGASLSGVVS
jgi:hypothetical protein